MNRSGRVLVVEDSPTQAARLRKLFEGDRLEVVLVPSAEKALEQLERTRPDLIVLDYNLPGMNGNDFCREIRLNVNTRAIPVLMLTSENSGAAETQGLASGADDYVVKSADPDILLVRVRALLRKAESEPAVIDLENRFGRAHLLAIDDSRTYLAYLTDELRSEHYKVEMAATPEKGIEMLAGERFDCVLVDFEMPGMDGATLCRRIRGMYAGQDPGIVLIVLSSYEDKERTTQSFQAGADDYIAKSADIAVVKARIRALLRRKFLVEENRRITEEIREHELEAMRARAERQAAEMRALMADRLAAANRELDRANRELEQFAYSAAHDLQEPLRKIRIFSQLLQRKYAGKLDAEADGFINYCVQGAGQMEQVIKDLLDYAKASKAAPDAAGVVDLNQVIRGALDNLQAAVEESDALVTSDALPSLRVEEIRIQQLFQNLIGNAIKYRRPQVQPRIAVTAAREEDHWVFTVTDNGIGIDAAFRDQVFEIFKRLNPGAHSGTGLGLAICKRIVESYGGRIWMEPAGDGGSSFRFTLPVSLEARSESLGNAARTHGA